MSSFWFLVSLFQHALDPDASWHPNLQKLRKGSPKGLQNDPPKHEKPHRQSGKQSIKFAQTVALHFTSRKQIVGTRRNPARRNARSALNNQLNHIFVCGWAHAF